MFRNYHEKSSGKVWLKTICRIILITFTINTLFLDLARLKSAEAQAILPIVPPGTLITPSQIFTPPLLKSIAIDPTDPFKLDFIMSASSNDDINEDTIKRLTQYFLTFLTIPEDDLWVNLSPYESDRIINDTLEQTIVGRDMLLSDYFLKQLAASMTYPERSLGETFWETLKKRIQEKYNLSELPVNSLTKIWVVPDKAVIQESHSSAYISESRLKVMLEEDYFQEHASKNQAYMNPEQSKPTSDDYRTLYREIIIPEIEKEVNEGAHFAQLRQIYHSLILAIWFKQKLKQHVVNVIYSDQKKITGINLSEDNIGEKVYAQYLESIKKGAYDYIKEDYDPINQAILSQHYFSGGFSFGNWSNWFSVKNNPILTPIKNTSKRLGDKLARFTAKLIPKGVSSKTLALTLAAVGCSSVGCSTSGYNKSMSRITPLSPPTHTQTVHENTSRKVDSQFYHSDIETFSNISGNNSSRASRKNAQAHQTTPPPKISTQSSAEPPPNLNPPQENDNQEEEIIAQNPPSEQTSIEIQHTHIEPELVLEIRQEDSLASYDDPTPQPSKNSGRRAEERTLTNSTEDPTNSTTQSSTISTSETIEQESIAIPLESSLHAPASGYVSGFDETKKSYKKGDLVFTIELPEVLEELEALEKELAHRKHILYELDKLILKGAATSAEINQAQTNVDLVSLKIKKLESTQISHHVYAPFDMQVNSAFITNGAAVQKHAKLINYLNTQRAVVTVQAPTHVNHIHSIESFLLDNQPVNNIISADWDLRPHRNGANITFVVDTSQSIPTSQSMDVAISIPKSTAEIETSTNRYPATITQVNRFITQPVTSPLDGAIHYHVEEGERVKAGQLLAEIDPTLYWEYFQQLLFTYNSLQTQLNQIYATPQTVQMFTQNDIVSLETQKNTVWHQIKTAQEELKHLQIFAPTDGIVETIDITHSNQFERGDTLLTVKSGQVIIGDAHNIKKAVLLSDDLALKPDDPVIVRTTQGIEIPATVILVNRNPIDNSKPLQGLQAVQIIAEDIEHVLGNNMPIKIIVPTDEERKTAIQDDLRKIAQEREDAKRVAAQQVTPEALQFYEPEETPEASRLTLTSNQPFNISTSIAGRPLSLEQLTTAVANNNLLTGDLQLEVLKKQTSEQLASRSLLNLNGGIYFTENNKLAFSGGISGAIEGLAAQASTGNAISASLPLVLQLSGNIIHKISGKEKKQEELAMQMTRIAQHHMEAEVINIVSDATNTYIALAEAQQHLEHLKTVKADLAQSMSALQKRLDGRLITNAPIDTLQQKIDELERKIEDWRLSMDKLNHTLHIQMGTSVSGTIDPFAPVLPWNGTFIAITLEQERRIASNLTGQHSRNYRMKEALAATTAMEQTIKLQNIGFLPSVDLHSVFISDVSEPSYNPFYNLVSGAVLRTSRMGEGGNGSIQWTLPLFDSERKTKRALAQIEQTKVALNLSRVKTDVRNTLTRVASELRILTQQIESATQVHQQRSNAFNEKVRTGMLPAEELITNRIALADTQEHIIKLKADYFLAEAQLRQLQVLDFNKSLVNEKASAPTPAPKSVPASGGPPPDEPHREKLIIIPETLSAIIAQVAPNKDDKHPRTYRVAQVRFAQDSEASENTSNLLWTIMQANSPQNFSPRLSSIRTSLIEEANIYSRTDSIKYFLTELSEERGFLETLEYIILNSPYTDVAEQLFDFMASTENRDVRFFIHIINAALEQKNDHMAQMGFQKLDDIIIEDPGLFDRFSEINLTLNNDSPSAQYFNDLSVNSARNVLTTFLIWAPEDSIAATTLLRSKYWNTSRLAEVHNSLEPLNTDIHIQALQDIIKDEILRRRIIENVPDFFNLGPFTSVQSDLIPFDFLNKFTLTHLSQANMQFLETSPDWRDARRYITPELFKIASKSTESTLTQIPSLENSSIIPNLDFIESQPASPSNTTYFASLPLEQQKRFIEEKATPTQLSHIVTEQPQLRGLAIDKLTETRQGRLLVLKAYNHSVDTQLDRLFEERQWHDALKADITATRHPGEYVVYRQALEKLYSNTQEDWPLNLRLATFQYIDTYGATDPRGDAYVNSRINLLSTGLSLKYHREKAAFKPRMFSRAPSLTADQHELITTMNHIIDTTSNPHALEEFLEERLHQKRPSTHKLLSRIVDSRDHFSQRIRNNDQNTSWMPLSKSIGAFLVLFSGIVLPIWLWFKYRKIKDLPYHEKVSRIGKSFQIEIFNNDNTGKTVRGAHKPPYQGALINIPDSMQNYKDVDNLKHWHKLISKWDVDTTTPETIINDLQPIINDALNVLRNIPFSPKLIWDEDGSDSELNEEYSKKLSYVYILTERTLNRIHYTLQQGHNLADLQETELKQNFDTLLSIMHYVTRYKRIIEYRQIFDKIMGYKLPEDHWAERSKIYPLARWVLLYTKQINMSVKGMTEELPILFEEGNTLINNLYLNPKSITQNCIHLIDKIFRQGDQLTAHGSSSMRTEYKMRSFRGRMLLVGFPIAGIIMAALGSFFGISGLVTFGLSFVGVVSLSIAVGNYWLPHIDIMQITWNKIMGHVNDTVEQRLLDDLDRNVNNLNTPESVKTPSQDEIITLAIDQGVEALRSELNLQQPPQVDMIVIIPEDAREESVRQLHEYVDNRRGSIIRHDVPVEIPTLVQQYNGSANAYIEALSYIRKKLADEDYRARFPHLQCDAEGTCREPKVMFVFHGNNNNQHAAVLDWSITNGYRVSHNTKGNKKEKQQHVLLYTRDAYFGPIKKFAGENITVLANWVSEDDLKNLGLLHLENNGTSPHVKEIYEKIHVPNLLEAAKRRALPSKLYYFLSRKFNIHNRKLLQYPAFYGIVVFNDKTVRILNGVIDRLDAEPELRATFEYLHLTLDLISVLMKGKNDVHETFLPKRVTFKDVLEHYARNENTPNLAKLYRRFYRIVLEERDKIEKHKLEVAAHLPHPGATELIRIDNDEAAERIKRLTEAQLTGRTNFEVLPESQTPDSASEADASVLAPEPVTTQDKTGGIDLSDTESIIEIQNILPNIDANPVNNLPYILPVFQGFEFKIIEYREIESEEENLNIAHLN